MTAQTLRDAAKMLRERAEACDPWQGDDDHGSWADEYRTDGGNGTDAALIRVMHPGVGLALADWLDEEAARIAAAASEGADARPYEPALRAADAIHRGDA